jgi:transcriptional regulator with XRE-family HTH domain
MGIPQQMQVAFRERVRDERRRRGWTQVNVAKMLSDKGFDDINNTVVSKIERGERMVRLAEAVGFADVFGVSLDYLLGRNPDVDRNRAFLLRCVRDTSRNAVGQLGALAATIRDSFADLSGFEFDGHASLAAEGRRASEGLEEAMNALMSIAAFELPDDAGRQART